MTQSAQPHFRSTRHIGDQTDPDDKFDLSCWAPRPQAIDRDVLGSKDTLEGRIIDMMYSDGYVAGAIEHHVNHVVGTGLRLNLRPEWRALGKSADWAKEFASSIEAVFRTRAESSANLFDKRRTSRLGALQTTAWRSFLIHGEILAVVATHKGRNIAQRSCIRLIDPARLCDPVGDAGATGRDIRGGIEFDGEGVPIAYWIANRHPRDFVPRSKSFMDKMKWTRVPARGRSGRKLVFHHFDPIRPEQTRGYSVLTPIVRAMKMIDRVSDATLQSALIQTLYALVIKSELDWDKAMEVLGATDGEATNVLRDFMRQRGEYYSHANINVDGLKALHLLPNEELELTTAKATNTDVTGFLEAMRTEGARGSAMSHEQFTGDYSKTNFSSARMSIIETNRGHTGRRARVMEPFCQDILEMFMFELFASNPDLFPDDVSILEDREALCRANWIGPPMIDADPEKTAKAAEKNIEIGAMTLADHAGSLGFDWEEQMEQRKAELEKMKSSGLFKLLSELSAAVNPTPEKDDGESDDGDDGDGGDDGAKKKKGDGE